MTTNDFAKFGSELNAFYEKFPVLCKRVHQESIIGITEEAVALTPYVTGAARSNFFWGIEEPSDKISTAISTTGAPSILRARAFAATAPVGGVVHMANTVAYFTDLEYGAADKEPYAVLRTIAARWKNIGERAVVRALR